MGPATLAWGAGVNLSGVATVARGAGVNLSGVATVARGAGVNLSGVTAVTMALVGRLRRGGVAAAQLELASSESSTRTMGDAASELRVSA